jgi:hypothetical protein
MSLLYPQDLYETNQVLIETKFTLYINTSFEEKKNMISKFSVKMNKAFHLVHNINKKNGVKLEI